eukprot:Filipodium_phascolosomae@DN2095_c0_g1_i1.p1
MEKQNDDIEHQRLVVGEKTSHLGSESWRESRDEALRRMSSVTYTEKATGEYYDDEGGGDRSLPERTGSIGAGIGLLGNSALGLAVLSVPFCASQAGLGMLLILLVLGGTASFTSFRLYGMSGVAVEERDPYTEISYQTVSLHAFPGKRWPGLVVDAIVFINTYGCLVSFKMVSGAQMVALFGNPLNLSPFFQRAAWITIVFVVVMLPLATIPFLKRFSPVFNWIGISAVVYCTILIIIKSVQAGLRMPTLWFSPNILTILYSIPLIACALCGHHNAFTAVNNLRERSAKTVTLLSAGGAILPVLLYFCVGIFGYSHLGSQVKTNVMDNYDAARWEVWIGKFGLAISMCTSYPLAFFPARACLLNLAAPVVAKMNEKAVLWGSTALLMVTSLIVALFVTSLDVIFSFMGITATLPMMFIMPGIYYWRLHPDAKSAMKYGGAFLAALFTLATPVFLGVLIHRLFFMKPS